MKPLEFCDLGIAYQCNYRCKMCRFWENSPLREENVLSNDRWKEVLRQLHDLPRADGFTINFSGPGEIFLRKGIFGLIRCADELGLKIQLISNASLVDEETARQTAESGLKFLSFSLDGETGRTHDYLRGVSGAREKVMRAIDNIARYSPETKISINTVITKVNLPEIAALTESLQKDNRIAHINFQAVTQPFSFVDPRSEQWFVREQDGSLWPDDPDLVRRTIDVLINFKKQGYKIADSVEQLALFRDYFLRPDRFIKHGRCNLGDGSVLIIDPVGFVSRCSLVGPIDSLNSGRTLKEIIDSPRDQTHRRNIEQCQKNCHLVVSCYYQDEES